MEGIIQKGSRIWSSSMSSSSSLLSTYKLLNLQFRNSLFTSNNNEFKLKIASSRREHKNISSSSISNQMSTNLASSKEEVKTKKNSTRLINLLNEKNSSKQTTNNLNNQTGLKFYDPPYLNKDPAFPNYELLSVSIKGYDFTVLDVYFKHIEKLCDSLKIEVADSISMPARSYKIKTYQPFSSNLDKEFKLNIYHRIVRVRNLKSTLAPFLFEAIQLNLPEGVQLSVTVPTREEDEFRYVPDIELNDLKKQLDEMTKKPKDELVSTKTTTGVAQNQNQKLANNSPVKPSNTAKQPPNNKK